MEKNEQMRAVLAAVDTGEYDCDMSVKELDGLCKTAGLAVCGAVVQEKKTPDAATFLGRGKLEELAQAADRMDAGLLVFDGELSGSQIRNIEELTQLAVLDRTTLILDIFAKNALTKEGAIQVELAQLRYRLPRLAGMGKNLSRLGAGIGTRGPGESKLESDRRHIARRIAALQRQLKEIERRRGLAESRRQKNGVKTVALAGYTNVGKSTLLNTLTGSGVLTENKLFATLDPTARQLRLPDGGQAVLIDTVGFISRLPHHLVEAFRSTLGHIGGADLILNVCDVTSPYYEKQDEVTRQVLNDLHCGHIPVLSVLNKMDAAGGPVLLPRREAVCISAKTGLGLPELLHRIERELYGPARVFTFLVPYSDGSAAAAIRNGSRLLEETYTDSGQRLVVRCGTHFAGQWRQYLQVTRPEPVK